MAGYVVMPGSIGKARHKVLEIDEGRGHREYNLRGPIGRLASWAAIGRATGTERPADRLSDHTVFSSSRPISISVSSSFGAEAVLGTDSVAGGLAVVIDRISASMRS